MDLALTDAQVAAIRAGVSETGGVVLALTDAQVAVVVGAPAVPAIESFAFDYGNVVCDTAQYFSSRYERFQIPLILTTTGISQRFQQTNVAGGGAINVSFAYPRYEWEVDGVVRASYTRVGTERVGTLAGQFGDEMDGLHIFTIVGVGADGSRTPLMVHGGYLDRAGNAKNETRVVLQLGSRDWESLAAAGLPVLQKWSIVDKATLASTRVRPIKSRLGVPFSTPLPYSKLTKINFTIPSDGVPRQPPAVTKSGVTVSEHRQPYFINDLTLLQPRMPLLDGPRGACTTHMVTDLRFGRMGKLYGADSWARWVIDASGTKRTLFGLRHKWVPLWTEATIDGPEIEVVGNWDASIPANERFAWESWGMAWDLRSLVINSTASPPIGEVDPPHQTRGATMFCSDRHGYILRAEFSPTAHAMPPTVTRHATSDDPWGMDADGTTLYVAERGKNRIAKHDMDTGAYLGALIEDTTASTLGAIAPPPDLRRWKGADYTTCRTHPIVAPEGVAILDGYLYWGSFAQREVRRVPLAGGPVEVVCRPQVDNNSYYVYIAISDGNFGPRGTVFVTTWSINNYGRPEAFLPVPGTASDGTPLTHSQRWQWQAFAQNVVQGPGGKYASAGYGAAVAVGRQSITGLPIDPTYGALACASSDGGLEVFMQAQLEDGLPPDYARMRRGYLWYLANAQVLHGGYCNGPDIPLPWGQNADADYWMQHCGFTQSPDRVGDLRAAVAKASLTALHWEPDVAVLTQQIKDALSAAYAAKAAA